MKRIRNTDDAPIERRGILRIGTITGAATGAAALTGIIGDPAQAAPPADKSTTYIPSAEKGTATGVATLDGQSKIPLSQIPDLSARTATQIEAALEPKLDKTDAAATYATLANVDSFLDAEQNRADMEYMKAPSVLFIPYDHSWWPAMGDEPEGFGPDSSGNPRRIFGLVLSGAAPTNSSANPGLRTRLKVPYGWNFVTITIHYMPTTATGGNSSWNGGLYNMNVGSAPNAGSGIAATTSAVGTSRYVEKVCVTTTPLAVDSTKIQLLHIYRNAFSASDTYADPVLFIGVELVKVS